MRVNALLNTHDLREESLPWMSEIREVFDELIIFIDEKRVTPGSIARAKRIGTHVYCHSTEIAFGWDLSAMVQACHCDWVFRFDYDEQLSPEWQQEEWRQLLETTEFSHFWCPRRQLVPGGRYLNAAPWYPDFQLRLFRTNLDAVVFPSKLHDQIRVPGPGGYFQHLAIHHHVLWLLPREMRVEKARRYEELLPGGGLGQNCLYEDYSPPTESLPEPVKLDIASELGWMDRLSLHEMSKLSLSVNGMPQKVSTSSWFWLEAEVTNGTDKSVGSFPPFPVRLAYHWIEAATRGTVIYEGNRTALFPSVHPNRATRYTMMIAAPAKAGEYILQTTMVQEHVCWFESARPDILQEFRVLVGP